MKKIAICIALLGFAALGGQAIADSEPAATLLLPYFEVDLDDPNGQTTLFSINNASAAPAIAHVVLWTDLTVPTLDFNVYLTGYDVQTFNLRDLFVSGTIPQTSHNDTTISPVGNFSLDMNPVSGVGPGSLSCDTQLPLPPLGPTRLAHIRNAHTGQPSALFGGQCSAQDLGDNVARGYITVDNVSLCSLEFPGDAGYFIDGGTGIANNINQLWGDFFYVDVTNSFAQGETLVHVEADAAEFGPGDYTFYARYSGGSDNREPLYTTFASRFGSFAPLPGGTDLICWRDSGFDQGPFACPNTFGNPSWYPLGQNQIVIFDEQENPDVPPTDPFSPPIPGDVLTPCPAETNRVAVGGPSFPVPYQFGWVYLNLNTTTNGSQIDQFNPIKQNWVGTIMSAFGTFSVGYDAIVLGEVEEMDDVILPICDGAPDPAACS